MLHPLHTGTVQDLTSRPTICGMFLYQKFVLLIELIVPVYIP